MNHHCSVFRNSCLKVAVDPVSKMPKTAYERKSKTITEQNSIDSVSTSCSVSTADVDAEKLKDFYRSIPDYNDINHLPAEQFYSTLKSLREKKKVMLGIAVEHIDDCPIHKITVDTLLTPGDTSTRSTSKNKSPKLKLNHTLRRKYSTESKDLKTNGEVRKISSDLALTKVTGSALKRPSRKYTENENVQKFTDDDLKRILGTTNPVREKNARLDRPKRIQSACSISWNDTKIENREVDQKFDQFFEGNKYASASKINIDDDFKTRSMPSSPLRMKRFGSLSRRRKSITLPKPFKMTERYVFNCDNYLCLYTT